jgi:thiamine-phosphate pyrophosphorylase
MKLHAIVDDLEVARTAVIGGATVVQLRIKHLPTAGVVERGRPIRELCRDVGVTFVVNDDLEAALLLEADGVHLGRTDPGADQALEQGLLLGLSAGAVDEAIAAEARGASYLGAGPVWETPSKPDADPAIGLEGLAEICKAVSIPVVAIGGVAAANAEDCVRAGAAGVAVIRAATDARALREAIERAAV